ncbi:hypothetical protein F1C76_04850 [Geodermatophilaceae bacterium NBWT11]|nr:hypothetical protein F1C76_04850 [Geodermatophilaceae bacterium NBWT11]
MRSPEPLVSRVRSVAVVVAVLAAFVALTSGAPTTPSVGPGPTVLETVADPSQFDPGNIISDAVFFDGDAMDAASVQSFLTAKGASCRTASDGSPCLKDFRQDTTTRPADARCATYAGAAGESAAAIIAKVGLACGINPRALLVMLQKEQGLVTGTGSASRYRGAMGFGCPDTAACDSQYYGFFNQVYNAARQFQVYAANPSRYTHRVGIVNQVRFSPTASCGAGPVVLQNQATAGLYNYTPYQPNAAALAAGYGSGNSCSAYGNRNFWLYFTDWFGSTQVGAADVVPEGNLDTVSSADGSYAVRGWVFDRTDTSQPVTVHVYVDGSYRTAVVADGNRPDVGAAHGVDARHGFELSVNASLGSHEVCVYAINIGGVSNPQLGCRTVVNVDSHAPVGQVDEVSAVPGQVTVRGWAFDPDALVAPTTVHVYVDGVFARSVATGVGRPDVAAAYGAGPGTGFSWTTSSRAGDHAVCVYALNVGRGSASPLLGCRQVTVPDPRDFDPVGSLDTATGAGGTVRVTGWALDPDSPTAPATVHVYVDGTQVASVSARLTRPDVAAARPGAGAAHGFDWSGIVGAGDHTVCVYALNSGYGTTNPTLGCRSVRTTTAAQANPFGALDTVVGMTGSLGLSGWVVDPDAPDAPTSVHVYVDGAFAASVVADGDRPDVAQAVSGIGPRHGYTWSTQLAPGRHTVCVYAINTGAGTTNPTLGCRSVVVVDPATRNPEGVLDSAQVTGGALTVSGWALDPDLPTTPVTVHVYVDGQYTGALVAGGSRPDIAGARPGAGPLHGFSGVFTAPANARQVCVFALNLGAGTTNPPVGCTAVRG